MVHAVGEAMFQAMQSDESVVVYGEDVVGGAGLGAPHEGAMGGTFGATKGLFKEFGPSRVRDTPISEAGLVGIAVGAAASGLRPVVDMMWSSFTPLAFDQIHNQAAKLRYMFGGQASVPMVLRMAIGAGLGAAGQHSDTLYSLYTHLPGIKVVVPTTPHDAKGLLLAAIADDDPSCSWSTCASTTPARKCRRIPTPFRSARPRSPAPAPMSPSSGSRTWPSWLWRSPKPCRPTASTRR